MRDRGPAEGRMRKIRYLEFVREGLPERGAKGSPEVKYVRVTSPGDTVFCEGDIVGLEALMKENLRVEEAGGRKAVGEAHRSPWLTPEQRRELVREFGHAAVAWAEAVTIPGDLKAARRAAEHWKRRLKETIGIA